MALLATSCTMRNKPSRLLDKGPDYLKTKTNDQIFERHRKSAVELLAASRPQYVKTPSVLDSATTPDRHFRSICQPREKPPTRSKSEFDVSKLRELLLDENDREDAARQEDLDSSDGGGDIGQATHDPGRVSASEWRPLSPESRWQRRERKEAEAARTGGNGRKESCGSSSSRSAEADDAVVSGEAGLTAGAPSPGVRKGSDCSGPSNGSAGRKIDDNTLPPDAVGHDERFPFTGRTDTTTTTTSANPAAAFTAAAATTSASSKTAENSCGSAAATFPESSSSSAAAAQKPAIAPKPTIPPRTSLLSLQSKPIPPPKPSFLLSPGSASQTQTASTATTTTTITTQAAASPAVIYTARPIYIDLNGSRSNYSGGGALDSSSSTTPTKTTTTTTTTTPKTPTNAGVDIASTASPTPFTSGRSVSGAVISAGRARQSPGSASGGTSTNASIATITPVTPVAAGNARSIHVISAAAQGRFLTPAGATTATTTTPTTTMSEESSDKTPTNPQGGVMTASDASSSVLAPGHDSDAAEAVLSPSGHSYDGHDFGGGGGDAPDLVFVNDGTASPTPPHPSQHHASSSVAAAAASAAAGAGTSTSKSTTSSPGHHRASLRSSDEFMAFSSGMSPVPRSFSDIACHHSRAGSDVSSEASRASRTSRASRASAGANLEKFFNEMGMDREVLDPMIQLQHQKYRGGGGGLGVGGGGGLALAGGSSEQDIYESVSSLDSRDARSICSTLSRSERELVSDSESFERNQQQTSIVERNARIIKWLCSVKKAKTPATGV